MRTVLLLTVLGVVAAFTHVKKIHCEPKAADGKPCMTCEQSTCPTPATCNITMYEVGTCYPFLDCAWGACDTHYHKFTCSSDGVAVNDADYGIHIRDCKESVEPVFGNVTHLKRCHWEHNPVMTESWICVDSEEGAGGISEQQVLLAV
mmetsp:Transcript_54099/g.97171  ORF Transcript_54099/g.97171 Transcript_54099/m.97171 type:complete len:148 (-) Transcript_54099:35-478(-)